MVLSDETRKELEEYLNNWSRKLVSKKESKYTDKELSSKGKIKPFHNAMLSRDLLKSSDFERSFSTGLGYTFEECARIIAKTKFNVVERHHKTENYIPMNTIAEVGKVISELKDKKNFPTIIWK